MSKSGKGSQGPSIEEIAAYAYNIYEQEGRPEGKHTEHWLQAEAHLKADHQARADEPAPKATAKSDPAPAAAPKGKSRNAAGWQAGSSAPAQSAPRANSR
ncbi:MAG TPA: DUF2934 domain-containing protein [Verrucomicrobiae bacterium]|jgi:hypothetical protein|nr:DUF2934 domain-containing protein [Verrucomicrobiae bacterium]